MQLLINNGADLNAVDQNGWTALHATATKNNKEAAEILLEAKPDLLDKKAFKVCVFASTWPQPQALG